MARKPRAGSDTVALTLRIREDLRQRIQAAADKQQVSMNHEITERLEDSFLVEINQRLIEVLLSSGADLTLLRLIAAALRIARITGKDWVRHDDLEAKKTVSEAIKKIVTERVLEERILLKTNFPHRNIKGSADYIAWTVFSEWQLQWRKRRDIKRAGSEARIVAAERAALELERRRLEQRKHELEQMVKRVK
jgi:hypothetical protein